MGFVIMLVMALLSTFQNYVFKPSSPFHAWEPMGLSGFLEMFVKAELLLIPIWGLVFMLPYRHIRRQMDGEFLEQMEAHKAKKAQEKRERREKKNRA